MNTLLTAALLAPPEEAFTTPLKLLAFVSVGIGAAAGYYLLVVRRRKGKPKP